MGEHHPPAWPLLVASLVMVWLLAFPAARTAVALPTGFTETTVFSGLNAPTAVRFASDGRVFVAEKSGIIKVFDGLTDTSPTTFADLRTQVHNFWDRGLLDLELDPSFPARPYVYVFYVHDAPIGGTAPRWGTAGATSDGCPTPPGATDDGCVVSSRLSRLQASGNVMTGPEQVLIEDWCQQYPSHSGSGMDFGADGALYVTGGEGASFNFSDYGQDGSPLNPCGDPPVGVGGTQTAPTAEGGRLRSQDLRTSADPVTLDGALIRVDPATGSGLLSNPLAMSPDLNARRIVAYGFRNPFRLAIRPGTNDVFVADVGGGRWEEIDRVTDSLAPIENFGWPCYEGGLDAGGAPTSLRHGGFDSLNLNICENLYGEGSNAVRAPYFAYAHDAAVVAGESCPTVDSAVTGLAFSPSAGTNYPAAYRNALFFADYSRDCMWVMRAGANGLPDPATRETFLPGASNPVDVQFGPDGDLYYVDHAGTIRRIRYTAGANQAPTAVATADPDSGPAPLTVQFDGRGSSDPNPGDTLSYAWDLDGDGAYDDSGSPTPTWTYTTAGTHTVSLRVTDPGGLTGTTAVEVQVNARPTASIASPAATTRWAVGDVIAFSGSATDPEDGPLPPSAMSWSLILHHCPGQCHEHAIQDFAGVASGSFTAPDHEYPSHLELRLTVVDSGGLTDTESVLLDPRTAVLRFESSPAGLQLGVGDSVAGAPFEREVIVGSRNTISASTPQTLGGTVYELAGWSDGGPATHEITAPASATTYTATFRPDALAPATPTQLTATAVAGRVDLGWTAATDNTGVTAYEVYRDGSLLATLGAVTSHSDTAVAPGVTYRYEVRAMDGNGNRSPFSDAATVTTPSTVTLTVAPAADARVEEATPTTNYGTSSSLKAEGGADPDVESYLRFAVAGVSGTVQRATLRVYATDATVDGPGAYATATAWSETGITWSNRPGRTSAARDDKGAIATGNWVEFDVTPMVTGDGAYGFVLATTSADSVHFVSRQSSDAAHRPQLVIASVAGPPDTERPAAPTNLAATAATATRVDLTWTAATDNVAVTAYEIYRDGGLLSTVGAVTSYQDATTTAGTTYRYEVRALDAAMNRSDPSNAASVTTPSTVTLTLNAEADSRVEEATPTTNFGTSSKLRTDGGADPDVESYLRFPAKSVPGVVRAARLRVYSQAGTDAGTADGPAAFGTSWTGLETALTWSNRPGRTTGATDDKGALGGGVWVEYDVTPIVTGDGPWSFVLATTSRDGVNFDSRQGMNKPELILTLG